MKGVILAGGLGRRLYPLTKITNKHLLPIYNKPMIYYPIEMLVEAGIRDIMIVTGGEGAGDFLRLIGNGSAFGLSHVNYTYQEGETGIAAALALAEEFAEGQKLAVVLGDNFLEQSIRPWVEAFESQESGARVFVKGMEDPSGYGVPKMEDDRIVRILEKPEHAKENQAIIGLFMYDADVFDIIRELRPAETGEFEITDVNNVYIERGVLEYDIIDGWWEDAGDSPDGLLRASVHVARRQGVV